LKRKGKYDGEEFRLDIRRFSSYVVRH
jgi:hypothetical protein